MNTTPTDETILKTDGLGRVRTPEERREQLLDEFERSGLSGQKFAALAGIKYSTFATWAQKRRRQRGAIPWSRASRPSQPTSALAGGGGGTGPKSRRSKPAAVAGVALARRSACGNQRHQTGGTGGGLGAGAGKAMLSFSGSLKVLVAVEACDMRKGFNGLHALVTRAAGRRPASGRAVCVQQPAAHADQNSVLGRDGFVGIEQATGAGNFFLAQAPGTGQEQVEADAAGAGDVDRWSGFARGETASVV